MIPAEKLLGDAGCLHKANLSLIRATAQRQHYSRLAQPLSVFLSPSPVSFPFFILCFRQLFFTHPSRCTPPLPRLSSLTFSHVLCHRVWLSSFSFDHFLRLHAPRFLSWPPLPLCHLALGAWCSDGITQTPLSAGSASLLTFLYVAGSQSALCFLQGLIRVIYTSCLMLPGSLFLRLSTSPFCLHLSPSHSQESTHDVISSFLCPIHPSFDLFVSSSLHPFCLFSAIVLYFLISWSLIYSLHFIGLSSICPLALHVVFPRQTSHFLSFCPFLLLLHCLVFLTSPHFLLLHFFL